MSMEGFSVAWLLNRENVDGALEIGKAMEATFIDYPHWRASEKHQREVRIALHKELLAKMDAANSAELVSRILLLLKRSEL